MLDSMPRTGPVFGWDPTRPIDMLSSLWSTATVAPVNTGAAAAYRTLFTTLRRWMLGRRMTIRVGDGDLTMTVTRFDARLDIRGLAVGQLSDVKLEATEISWNGSEFDRASAILRNVHVRPGVPPVLVAAPVELTLEVPTDALADLFGWATPRVASEIGPDGVASLRLSQRPRWGRLEVDASLDGSTLWLHPRAVVAARTRLPLPTRTPAYPVHLPALPNGLQLTGIEFAPRMVVLSGSVPEWRMDVPRPSVGLRI